jgi:MFS family permease
MHRRYRVRREYPARAPPVTEPTHPPADVPAGTERTRSIRELFASPHAALAVGVLLLEFSAGLTVYVSAVVVPTVIADLHAARDYPLIVSATSVGLFLSLVAAARLLRRVGPRPVLAAGLILTVAGALVSAAAASALVFACGRFAAALGSGLLGVFGTAAVIASVPQGYRTRLFALTSAMWILPGMVGPAAAVAVVHAVGWRWTLLMVVPPVLLARVLVGRAALRSGTGSADGVTERRPLAVSLLLPAGMAFFVFGSAGSLGTWSLLGLAVALIGAVGLLPAGTARLAAGPPRFLALLAVVCFGYFGADALMTAIGTRADGLPLIWVSVALGASAVCWSLGSMLQPRLSGSHGQHGRAVLAAGVATMAVGAGAIVAMQTFGAITGPALLIAWCVAGAGMGLAYPILYLQSTTATASLALDAGTLATAVLVAESLGSVLGTAAGSAIVDVAQRIGASEADGLHAAMMAFTAALVLGVPIALLRRRDAAARASVTAGS